MRHEEIYDKACKVIVKDGDMVITGPNGEVLPVQEELTLVDPVKDGKTFTRATVTFIVDIRGLEKA